MKQVMVMLLFAIGAVQAASQTAEQKPQFDVASIKAVLPPFPTGGDPWIANHGRFKAEAAQVRGVIAAAYRVLPAQVEGGPAWIDREPYSFDAKAENEDAGPDQIRTMVQTL